MAHSASRRSTLASVDPNLNYGQGSAPIPSSAIKATKTFGSNGYQPRQSMLPQQSHHPRLSILPGTQPTGLLQAQQQLTTPHHLAQSGRRGDAGIYASRQSIASAGRQSMAQPTPNHRKSIGGRISIAPGNMINTTSSGVRETRPIKDKHYKARAGAILKEYLEKTGFAMVGWDANKGVHEPTQSAFVGMFRHIYQTCIDESFKLGADGKKFEDEVLMLMKEIKYPAAEELSKTKLTAAGSQNNWPYCLAMLEWMINLGTSADTIGAGPVSRVDEEDDLQSLFFPYLWKCYDRFWENQDSYPEEYEELGACFDRKNAAIEQELKQLHEEYEKLESELSTYTGRETPLQVEQKENEMLNRDVAKFKLYHDDVLVPKLERTKKANERLLEEIKETEVEIHTKRQEGHDLQRQVDAQEMSAEEYERMASERDRLQKQLVELGELNRKATEDWWRLQLNFTKKQAEVEKRLRDFNPLATKIKLLPTELTTGETLYELELMPGNPSTMLPPGVDVKGVLRPRIEVLRSQAAGQYREASNKRLHQQERLEEINERVNTAKLELVEEETKLRTLKEQGDEAAKMNTLVTEQNANDQQRAELSINQADSSSRNVLNQAESRLNDLRLKADQLEEEVERKRSKMDDEMLTFVVLLSKMKGDVASQLREVQAQVTLKSRDD
ncbi:kinetochore-associated Ndc80 complex subunit ndc80 [Thecaphora frezii]